MKMKLAAAAVAAALVAPVAAQADVTVYGLAQLELAQIKVTNSDSVNSVLDSKNSRIGFRFSEDLGDGLKANGEIEYGPQWLDSAANQTCAATSTSTSTSTAGVVTTSTTTTCTVSGNATGIYARQQWIGLSGAWGEFQIGTLLQPYKYSGGVKYDAFVATGLEARSGNGGMIKTAFGQGGYFSNALGYKNTFGGVQVWVAYSPEKDADYSGTTKTSAYNGAKGDTMAAVVVPFSGGEVGVAYAKDKYATTEAAGTAGEKNSKIFGKYSFGPSTILAQYEKQKAATSANDEKVTFVAYQFKMGTNTFVAQLGKEKKENTAALDTKYTALGVIHGFSKNTSGFLGYRKTDLTGSGDDTKVIGAGLSIKF